MAIIQADESTCKRNLKLLHKINIIFPPGSRLRIMSDLVTNALLVLKNEGISSLIEKVRSRMHPKSSVPVISLQEQITPLHFPLFDAPRVSIVIPVFNNALYTFNCLLSILQNTQNAEYEIIVVDNASTDATRDMLSRIENIVVIRNEENMGFIGACNTGAKAAKGEYIHFLNNDTVVMKGWLSALLSSFEEYPLAGAVGSKLIYPDLKLQEAGGIIWKDASGCNYGRLDRSDKPEYNYVREVDYCSGASLMVRKSLFQRLGGFDLRFSPAYWEDTDLCFSIRKIGCKVLYQPASVVVHFEGISAGTSTSSGMKRFQELNKPKFIEKWSDELNKQYESSLENFFLARDRNRNKKILVIDHVVPTFDKDAGSFFMHSLLRALASMGYRVVFLSDSLFSEASYAEALQQMGIEVLAKPVNFKKYMKRYGRFFDVAILTRTHVGIRYIDVIKRYIPQIVYHAPDLEFIREQRRAGVNGTTEKLLKKIKEREFYLFSLSNLITIHSPDEKLIIQKKLPTSKIEVIPLPVRKIISTDTAFKDRRGLLFVGSSHAPNADAVKYFTNEILPVLLQKLPDIKFYIMGNNPPKSVQALASNTVIVGGFVKDLLPYYEKCRVYVAPLRYGAGVKGKIIEAMSYGLPVVTTSIGAEGLNVSHRENILIADSREDYAEAVMTLYNDEGLWNRIRQNALKHVEENLSQEIFFKTVKKIMDGL